MADHSIPRLPGVAEGEALTPYDPTNSILLLPEAYRLKQKFENKSGKFQIFL